MPTRPAFAVDEWYHCYNRGVDKRIVFERPRDYERFLLALYASNSEAPVHVSNLRESTFAYALDSGLERGESIVEIGAYCLMPNHFHLVLREIKEGGIARFMQKVSTGYTMYFNKKQERTGALFAGTFKSKHVPDDRYLKHLIAYVHLNPAELFDPRWKHGKADTSHVRAGLMHYAYSSFADYNGEKRPARKLLGDTLYELYEKIPSIEETIDDAHAYYEYQG